jgi:integrase
LGLYTGLRLGDCATLRWGEVDLDLGLIRRIPNKTARRNPKPVLVPIHPVLSGLLAETPAKQRRDYVLPNTAEQYQLRTDLVTDTVQQHFRNCEITLHKVGTGTEGKRAVIEVGFHSLRHSFVSLCRASNAPLAVVESIVGHSSPAMTRHYTHTGELEATRAVALLPTIIGDPKASRNSRPSEPEKVLLEAQHIARSITAKNWKAKKATLLALLDQQRG